jgi:thioredoxin 1
MLEEARKVMNDDAEKKDESPRCECGGSCCGGSGKWIWIILALAIVGVLIAKNAKEKETTTATTVSTKNPPSAVDTVAVTQSNSVKIPESQAVAPGKLLPRLVDLGAGKCIPCKLMTPILADLKSNYVGKLDVEFIDVWEKPDEGTKYKIETIPTQIFYGPDGKELFRHEGFFPKKDILAKWKEFGIDLGKATP